MRNANPAATMASNATAAHSVQREMFLDSFIDSSPVLYPRSADLPTDCSSWERRHPYRHEGVWYSFRKEARKDAGAPREGARKPSAETGTESSRIGVCDCFHSSLTFEPTHRIPRRKCPIVRPADGPTKSDPQTGPIWSGYKPDLQISKGGVAHCVRHSPPFGFRCLLPTTSRAVRRPRLRCSGSCRSRCCLCCRGAHSGP